MAKRIPWGVWTIGSLVGRHDIFTLPGPNGLGRWVRAMSEPMHGESFGCGMVGFDRAGSRRRVAEGWRA